MSRKPQIVFLTISTIVFTVFVGDMVIKNYTHGRYEALWMSIAGLLFLVFIGVAGIILEIQDERREKK